MKYDDFGICFGMVMAANFVMNVSWNRNVPLFPVRVADSGFPNNYSRTGSCLLRKYICGVVPSIFRNISIKALTLS